MLTPAQEIGVRYVGWMYCVVLSCLPVLTLRSLKKLHQTTAGNLIVGIGSWLTVAWIAFCFIWPYESLRASLYLMFLPTLPVRWMGF